MCQTFGRSPKPFELESFPAKRSYVACDGSCWQKNTTPDTQTPDRPPARRKTQDKQAQALPGTCNHHDDHDGEEQYCTYMHQWWQKKTRERHILPRPRGCCCRCRCRCPDPRGSHGRSRRSRPMHVPPVRLCRCSGPAAASVSSQQCRRHRQSHGPPASF